MSSEHRRRVGVGRAADRPVRFDEFWDWSLYDEDSGFYTAHGGAAGRRASFLTSPELGGLFGRLVAALADREWHRLGQPDPFWFVDAGAGPGGLTRSVVFAEPECAPALRALLVERSPAQRAAYAELCDWAALRGVRVDSADALPETIPAGLIFANELLDNLAARWCRVVRTDEAFSVQECWVDSENRANWLDAPDVAVPPGLGPGDSFPLQGAAHDWVAAACSSLGAGRVVATDYGVRHTSDFSGRDGWMRTYAHHSVGTDPFASPGWHDLTADVAFDQLPNPSLLRTQAEALADWGIGQLLTEARVVVDERAAIGDLRWARARSVIAEAESLCELTGLGGFLVGEWVMG